MTLTERLEEARLQHITPYVAASIGNKKEILWQHALGCPENQEFDLASLTKLLCTTLLCAQALAQHKINLDDEPFHMWPGVKIRHLLNHTSGLKNHEAFYQNKNKPVLDLLWQEKPDHAPGERTCYSDLGFMALGYLLEQRFHKPLDILFNEISKRYFEHQMHFKKGMEVNDDNCKAMGGIAGHAGLFGTLEDVQSAAKWFLKCILGHESSPTGRWIYKMAFDTSGKRGLGFDRAEKEGSTGGYLSPNAVGHLGFTGVSLWLDPIPPKGRFYVLLTHRLAYGNHPQKIRELRKEFHRLASQLV